MTVISSAERVRASKLRAKVADGKTLTAADSAWLATYEQSTLRAKAAKAKAAIATMPAPVVAGPQLALGGKLGAVSPGVHVNTTKPVDAGDRIDPSTQTWIPTMPEAPKDAEKPVDGAPKPPPPGTPLVDPAQPAQAQGDPHAAEQFAAFVMLITSLGVGSARELAAEYELPEQARQLLGSDEVSGAVVQHIGEAAKRIAIKYGFTSVPMADEATVAAAVLASAALMYTQQKRKKLKGREAPKVEQPKQPQQPETPTTGLNELWRPR